MSSTAFILNIFRFWEYLIMYKENNLWFYNVNSFAAVLVIAKTQIEFH
jgi:hypothetical protein